MIDIGIDNLISIINSTIVNTSYDGFLVQVDILTISPDIESACYLYVNDRLVSKKGYVNNGRYTFYMVDNHTRNIKVKIFFRYKANKIIKKSRFFNVITSKALMYCFSEGINSDISPTNCEIVNNKLNTVEAYEEQGFQPRADREAYRLSLPIDWLADPFKDGNWMFQLHAWRMLDVYLNKNEAHYLSYASKIINDWVAFEKKHKSKWLWYDMSTGLRALKISLYLKKCCEVGVAHHIEDINYLLHEHLNHLSIPEKLNPGNHGLFQLHGLKSLIHILKSCGDNAYSLSELKCYANECMSKLVVSQLGQYGVHTENSPDYHFFAHKKITNIVKSPWWSDLSKDIFKLLELGEYAKSWLVFPNNKCVPIGDSSTASSLKNLSVLEMWPHVKFNDQIGARVDGYAVVRSVASVPMNKSFFLFFQGSFYSHIHKHCDDLSFILQEKGVNLLIDSGKYGYQQDKYRNYFLSTRAHNTVEIDEVSTTRKQKYAYGSALIGQPMFINNMWVLKGKVEHILNQYTHERTVIYEPGVDLYVIDIIYNNNEKKLRNINQWWHFDSDSEVCISDNGAIIKTSQNTSMEITSESSGSSVNYNSYKGYEAEHDLIGWVSNKYLQYQPTFALKISAILKERTIILTRFNLDNSVFCKPKLYMLNNELKVEDSGLSELLII